MKIPKKIADILIEYIDLQFLTYNGNSKDSEYYLSSCNDLMGKHFMETWTGEGTRGSCWDSQIVKVYAQEEPLYIYYLDLFIEHYFKDIQEEIKPKIYEQIEYDSIKERDYYGGTTIEHIKFVTFENIANVLSTVLYGEHHWEVMIDFDDLLKEHSEIVIHMEKEDYYKLKLNENLNEHLEEKDKKIVTRKI